MRQDPEVEAAGLAGRHEVQVAVALDPKDGQVVVLVRFGRVLSVLTPDGADALGDSLKVEAAIAKTTASRRTWESWKHDD